MTNRLGAAALTLLLTFALVGCSGPASSPAGTDEPTATAEPSETADPTAEETAEESAEESEEAAAEERVRIDGSVFEPAQLTIAAGTEVTFLNADGFGHTVTEGTGGQAVEDPIVDEEIAQNGSVSVTFDEPGTYDITCRIHPSMQMTIVVEG